MTHDPKSTNNNGNVLPEIPEDKDQEKSPAFIAARPGRMVSFAGLIERIIEQFQDEYGEEGAAVRDATDSERRKLLRDVADYVIGVESVQLSREDLLSILQTGYSDIFGYGTLDNLFADPTITTIALEGSNKVSVRYQPGTELVALDAIFEDIQQMRRMMQRLVRDSGATLSEDIPVLEVGLTVAKRPVCLNLAMPPFVIHPTADIRLHPETSITLDKLIDDDYLTPDAATFLRALVISEHGFIIVGDTESGKTTLLSALMQHLASDMKIVSVERAGELRLPENAVRHTVQWAVENDEDDSSIEEISFGDCIEKALTDAPDCLVLDEVRADEPKSIAPLLNNNDVPRQIWSFRGSVMPMRIRSSLAQLARMAYPAQPEGSVHGLYTRLPFIVIVQRRRGYIRLRGIAEWQFSENTDYPDFVELMSVEDGTLQKTGQSASLALDLPDNFWKID
ncbi:MAG: ATPase, T2SS/T4P/T4SS family [Aggregatilineales bacterium]